ncbi:methyltransferase domain-containing protein [uncultured Amnibacterium sp.]|uniref:methyltransferase domain-containing protein n=1 Tax=uncultured Amnibacterium sp. TaxID=1631851 RepID=UPI0035CC29B2
MSTAAPPTFGAGGGEPYGFALDDGDRTLTLHEYRADPGGVASHGRRIDLDRFLAAADDVDGEAIEAADGPVLDIGCGPGRMLRAAAIRGHVVLGIDVSAAAVRIAGRRGLPVLRRSVFECVPGCGRWGTAILLDGNIGIGGDPVALLQRCVDLVRPHGGRVVIETHPDPLRDRAFQSQVVDDLGRRSVPFAWAEVGVAALRRHAASAGLVWEREWAGQERSFAEYVRP